MLKSIDTITHITTGFEASGPIVEPPVSSGCYSSRAPQLLDPVENGTSVSNYYIYIYIYIYIYKILQKNVPKIVAALPCTMVTKCLNRKK